MVGCAEDRETAILVNDKEFSMHEFGRLLSMFEGWGMRIIFAPEDEICQSPPIEMKDPDSKKSGSISLSAGFVSNINH